MLDTPHAIATPECAQAAPLPIQTRAFFQSCHSISAARHSTESSVIMRMMIMIRRRIMRMMERWKCLEKTEMRLGSIRPWHFRHALRKCSTKSRPLDFGFRPRADVLIGDKDLENLHFLHMCSRSQVSHATTRASTSA